MPPIGRISVAVGGPCELRIQLGLLNALQILNKTAPLADIVDRRRSQPEQTRQFRRTSGQIEPVVKGTPVRMILSGGTSGVVFLGLVRYEKPVSTEVRSERRSVRLSRTSNRSPQSTIHGSRCRRRSAAPIAVSTSACVAVCSKTVYRFISLVVHGCLS